MPAVPALRCRGAALAALATAAVLVAGCGSLAPGAEGREVRAHWMADAQRGAAEAQYRVGSSYCCGRGITHNTQRAVAWLCRAAVQGHRDAEFELANIYAGRISTTDRIMSAGLGYDDPVQAYVWYTAALIHGHPLADQSRADILPHLSSGQQQEARTASTRWARAQCPPIEP